MIRVIHVLGGLNRGGAETMVMNFYRAINKTKIQFDFIIHTEEKQDYEEEILSLGGKIYRFPQFLGKNYYEMSSKWKDFFDNHREYRILHSHVRSYASLYIPIAKKYGLKTIVHSHSTSNGKGLSAIAKLILQYPLRFQADYFFGCSREAGEWLFGKKVVNSEKYYMLQNAIDTNLYIQNTKIRKEYRHEMGIEGKKVFLHVGRLHPSKNHSFLLKVFAELVKKESDSVLLVVGDGELKSEIEKDIRELRIAHAVKMLGSRSDVPNLLQAADCFLFPSRWEGLPVTVVEAQAAGLPCFISDTITRDVDLSELVRYLPINNGFEPWVESIEKADLERMDVLEKIVKAGFDIQSSAKWLSDFYMRISKNE